MKSQLTLQPTFFVVRLEGYVRDQRYAPGVDDSCIIKYQFWHQKQMMHKVQIISVLLHA